MTEFAIIAPVFLLLIVGLLVFGRLFFYWIETNHLANETARWAVVDKNPYRPSCPDPVPLTSVTGAPGCKSLQQHARDSATVEFKNNARVCIEFLNGKTLQTVVPGDPIRVKVELHATFLKFFGFGVTIRGASTMRLENLATGTDPTAYSIDANPAYGNIGPCT